MPTKLCGKFWLGLSTPVTVSIVGIRGYWIQYRGDDTGIDLQLIRIGWIPPAACLTADRFLAVNGVLFNLSLFSRFYSSDNRVAQRQTAVTAYFSAVTAVHLWIIE